MRVLDAFGPLRESLAFELGEAVLCWAGAGTVTHVGAPFNGVQGIHAYTSVTLTNGHEVAEMVDRLSPATPADLLPEGMLW